MAQREKYGSRGIEYSAWHRADSLKRFLDSYSDAAQLSMIDLDAVLWIEYANKDRKPLLLIETARDTGQRKKPSSVMMNIAIGFRWPIAAYVVLYTLDDKLNPADGAVNDICRFRVKKVYPHDGDEFLKKFFIMTPKEYANFLNRKRKEQINKLDEFFKQNRRRC